MDTDCKCKCIPSVPKLTCLIIIRVLIIGTCNITGKMNTETATILIEEHNKCKSVDIVWLGNMEEYGYLQASTIGWTTQTQWGLFTQS